MPLPGSREPARGGRGTRTPTWSKAPAACWGPSMGPEAERTEPDGHLHLRQLIQLR